MKLLKIAHAALAGATLSAALCWSTSASANLIVNGSFEDGLVPSVSPWVTTGGVLAGSFGTALATDGDRAAVLAFDAYFNAAAGSLSQSFTVSSAGLMDYAFQAGRSEGSGLDDVAISFVVRIDGNVLSTALPNFSGGVHAGSVTATDPSSSYLGSLFLEAGLHEFSFDISRPGTLFGRSPYFVIDGVSVTEQVSAVPEPETYAMLLAGLGLLGFLARRRKLKLTA